MTTPKTPNAPAAAGDRPQAAPAAGDRIAKLLARAGVASRREVERMIDEGRVAIGGVVVETPATVLASLRGVTVDGTPVEAPGTARLFVYHKPPGLLVTERDPAGRPTIYDRLPRDLPRVVPVGRLDLATEGLLLLTTDGGLKRQLELPATGVERTYRARAYGAVTQAQLEELIEGVEIEGIRYGSIDANLERRTGANVWIELTLTEGKNREVRRVLEHLGLQVSRLIRTRYGPFILGDMPAGEVGEVLQHDLVAFAKTLKSGRATPMAERIAAGGKRSPASPRVAPAGDQPRMPRPFSAASRTEPERPSTRPVAPAHARPRSPAPDRGPAPATAPGRPYARPTRTAPARSDVTPAERPRRTDTDPRRDPATLDREERPRRGSFRTAKTDGPRKEADRPRRGTFRPDKPDATRTDAERPRRTGVRGDARPVRAPSRPGTSAPQRPGKGPAGGRGHPPRPPKGKR